MKIYKFVKWDVPALEKLQDSKVYQLRKKIDNGEKLSRDEKNWITEQCNCNSYSRYGIPLQGWMFSFADVLKTFWVKQHGYISECTGIDKTAIRQTTYGRIDNIVMI